MSINSDEELATILLRFRDLSTSEGKTIRSHKDIIAQEGYVWWGWWSKRGEKIPRESYGEINERATHGGATVYLFDSGQQKFYRANLLEISSTPTYSPVESPDREATPDYYHGTSYLAWYKLGSIELEDETRIIGKYSYLEDQDFFNADYGEPFKPFKDKVIVSARELSSQDRTVWFLRESRDGDDTAEVLLAKEPTFDNFVREIKQTSGAVVLVSDLHFPHNGDPFPTAFRDSVYPLKDVVPELTEILGHNIAGLILAGDVTTKGESKGFDEGADFVRQLKSVHKLEDTDILTVPGNHDFGYSDEVLEKGKVVGDTLDAKAAAYKEFYHRVMGRTPEADFSCGFKYLLDGGLVEVAALNSVRRQQLPGFTGIGFVGADQLEKVKEKMRWSVSKVSAVRVLVLHHHLIPVNYSETPVADVQYSLTLDAEAVIRWALECEIDLVIHGHQHQVAAALISRPVSPEGKHDPDEWPSFLLCGLGSAGAKGSDLGDPKYNTVGLMRIETSRLWFEVYKIRPRRDASRDDLVYRVSIPLR